MHFLLLFYTLLSKGYSHPYAQFTLLVSSKTNRTS